MHHLSVSGTVNKGTEWNGQWTHLARQKTLSDYSVQTESASSEVPPTPHLFASVFLLVLLFANSNPISAADEAGGDGRL